MPVGSTRTPLRVAIIGSGPSGFYAAEHLQHHPDVAVQIDMFDRLPTPFGLVRGGVAPDHPKIKSVTRVFDGIADHPEFRFYGNVEFGRDLVHEDLLAYYQAVIYAVGARSDRRMGIPREYLPGSHSASEFVGWYNAHPDQRSLSFNLATARAVVVGNGNVAIDIARILVSDPAALARTDIAAHALRALGASEVREVVLLGRRGPRQAAFTHRELRDLARRDDLDVIVDPADVVLDPHSRRDAEQHPDRGRDQNVELLRELAELGGRGRDRRIVMRFLVSPVEVVGEDHVQGVVVARNELYRSRGGALAPRLTDERETISTNLVFRAIGYQGVALPGVPFDGTSGTIPNDRGRVIDPVDGHVRPGEYVTGWIKRGPTGVIGTNKPDSQETADMVLEDLRAGHLQRDVPPRAVLERFLSERRRDYVSYDDWRALDALERARGEEQGAPRVKFARIEDMLRALGRRRDEAGA